jgi:hypothetical protein
MPIKYFYLQNTDKQYLNVKYTHNDKPTKSDYILYYSNDPISLWYMYENIKDTGVINLKGSSAHYTAYGIEYNGIISLSYNSKEWKLTDGLSVCCLSIENNQIMHPINHNEGLNVIF